MTTATSQPTISTGAATVLRDVSPQELRDALASGQAALIDVREPDEFATERIEGALNCPLSAFDPAAVQRAAAGKQPILHCLGGVRSADAANRLLAAGWPQAAHLDGGLNAWKAAGLPTTGPKKGPIPLMRQVQIAAGSLVFLGTVLGAFVSPWFLLLSGFVGAGLVFAGASGFCGMANLLAAMPWNRSNAKAACCADPASCSDQSCCS